MSTVCPHCLEPWLESDESPDGWTYCPVCGGAWRQEEVFTDDDAHVNEDSFADAEEERDDEREVLDVIVEGVDDHSSGGEFFLPEDESDWDSSDWETSESAAVPPVPGDFEFNALGTKRCPMCGERVDRMATVCPGCGEPFAETLHALLGRRMRYLTAGLWLRWMAFVIDGLVLSIPLSVVFLLLTRPSLGSEEWAQWVDLEISRSALFLILYAVAWPYFAVLESCYWQATFGKQAVGLQVTDISGRRLSFVQATIRHFSKLVSAWCVGLGFAAAIFSDAGQCWHDVISNAVVIRKR